MNRINDLDGTSQDICYIFDFLTEKVHPFIDSHNKLIRADRSVKAFDRMECFPWLKNESDSDCEVSDLILDCVCLGKGKGGMDILPGLLEAMPGVDPSTITFGIKGKEKGPGEPVHWDAIRSVTVYANLKEGLLTNIKDDELHILKKVESGGTEYPEGYSAHGSGKNGRKAKKKAETRKPGLHIVQKRGDRKEKWTRKKESRPDVIKYFKKVNPKSKWDVTFKAMIKDSKYRDLAMDSRTGHKRPKKARIYSRGVDRLVDTTGQGKRTVERHIKLMIEQKIIKEVWHGFKGQGYSRIEIPWKMSHVFAWRRKPPD
ncbi:hypothetical protein ES703_48417 [subsurface metagenome]